MRYQPHPVPKEIVGLALADGSTWGIVAGDEKSSTIVSRLADTMQMCAHHTPAYQLLVLTDLNGAYTHSTHLDHGSRVPVPWTFLPPVNNTFTCIVHPARSNDMLANQLVQLSLVIAQQSQTRGGFLLHGALIEKYGLGMILAGPGGVGKTTASRRLPVLWRSLSDDATLVVCDEKGAYCAHPWPTWSNFMSGGTGGTWDVNRALPLKAIFFLSHAQKDHIEPMGAGNAVSFLVELIEHTSWAMSLNQGKQEIRALRLQRFENVCTLVKMVPCFRLHHSLDGAFWEEIERIIT
jgi:SynChlorMet cassette protein ScmC